MNDGIALLITMIITLLTTIGISIASGFLYFLAALLPIAWIIGYIVINNSIANSVKIGYTSRIRSAPMQRITYE